MYDFVAICTRLEEGSIFFKRFDPKYFALKDVRDGKQLVITDSAKAYGQEDVEKLHAFNHTGPATIGCPAMVNFNGSSAVRKLWDWHIELAETIYSYRFGAK